MTASDWNKFLVALDEGRTLSEVMESLHLYILQAGTPYLQFISTVT